MEDEEESRKDPPDPAIRLTPRYANGVHDPAETSFTDRLNRLLDPLGQGQSDGDAKEDGFESGEENS